MFNYNTHRQEGCLKRDVYDKIPEAIKVCKFLAGTDILVSADLDGWLHFWCVTAWPHPHKNTLLCSKQDDSLADFQTDPSDEEVKNGGGEKKKALFPIRAMDYDPKTNMLYTGDEMGYLAQWDLTSLIRKCELLKPKEDFDPNLTEKEKEAKRKMAK